MVKRVFNFSAGPATLPLEVLKLAQEEFLDYNSSGMSVMELSHRSKVYDDIIKDADADFFELKAYVYVGYSQYRLCIENMPRHPEIMEFAKKVSELSGLKIIAEKKVFYHLHLLLYLP